MKKVFLSHSSRDKERYLRPLVKKLKAAVGEQRLVYDEATFEEGLENKKLISDWLNKTDLFVFFISDDSLNSEWVKKEILEAKELMDEQSLSRIYPIIIDEKVTYEDSRIPDWMRNIYNIRLITKPSVAARKIVSRMTEISWELNPNLKKIQQLFVGRNELMNQFEMRMDSFEKALPVTLIASGLNGIGRRTFLKHGLTKMTYVSDSYFFPTIKIDSHQSIEDFLLLLDDFGISDYDLSKINLTTTKLDTKIDIAVDMLIDIHKAREVVLVIDEGGIVSPTRTISDWFMGINQKLADSSPDIYLCLVSKNRTNAKNLFSDEFIYSINVPELSQTERKGLFTRYSRLKHLDISPQDMTYISSFLTGLPAEVYYACDIIEENGISYLKKNIETIQDYSDRQASTIVKEYEGNDDANALLALIAKFDFISAQLLDDITGNETKYVEIVNDFFAKGILDSIGTTDEYFILNSAIKNYVLRQRIPVSKDFSDKIKDHVSNFVENYKESQTDRDISDVFFSLKQELIKGDDVAVNLLIPSHYLKSMKELYDKRTKDSQVIKLADQILLHKEFLDDQIIHEIRYFLCSALARMKKERFKEEVQNINGPEHDFLFGFYYRQTERYEEAALRLNEALKVRPKFGRAKRELVTVYNNMDEYDKAFELSRENYEENKSNEYHIQSYFQSLLFMKSNLLSSSEKQDIMAQLLSDMLKINSDKSNNMYAIMSAQYELLVLDNVNRAIEIIEDAKNDFPEDVYILLCQFDVYEKANDTRKMHLILDEISIMAKKPSSRFYRDYRKCQAIYEAKCGNLSNAQDIIRSSRFPENSARILRSKIERIKSVK